MRSNYQFFSNVFLFNTVLFIGFSFEFFIRHDYFFGSVVIFNGLLNLVAYQSSTRKRSVVYILLNFFNGILSYLISDGYGTINYKTLYFIWLFIVLFYLVVIVLQIRTKIASIKKRKRIKKRFQ
ncbi:MAG: hypothetical protein DWP98_01275 [Bacteroidetes bacterium]|nr:MAG: hypothetical protein DWP98_01275 [Bacteroidota bacterium]MBL1144410.1 hypothetical protein [Bacteroidota bacterium]